MKIINSSSNDAERRFLREMQLDYGLINQEMKKWDASSKSLASYILRLPLEEKEAIYFQNLELEAQHRQWEELEAKHQFLRRGLPRFPDFPAELRLKIWGYALEPYTKPRIHRIEYKQDKRGETDGIYLSNQKIPNLLHICYESRKFFLENMKGGFAFGSYINYEIDICYCRNLGHFLEDPQEDSQEDCQEDCQEYSQEDFQENCQENFQEDSQENFYGDLYEDCQEDFPEEFYGDFYEDFQEDFQDDFQDDFSEAFQKEKEFGGIFFSSPEASKIKYLALDFADLLGLCLGRFRCEWTETRLLPPLLPSLKTILVVFDDARKWDRSWLDLTATFRDLSVREKKKGSERNHARGAVRFWKKHGLREAFRLVTVEDGDEIELANRCLKRL